MIDHLKRIARTTPLYGLYQRHYKFRLEYSLINKKPITLSTHQPSVIHYTLNKSASQYIKKILRQCGKAVGYQSVHFADLAFNSDFPYLSLRTQAEEVSYMHVFRPKGFIYSAFGRMTAPIPNFDQYCALLVIRDPRDILVSKYFSRKYSHPEPGSKGGKRDQFLEWRKHAQHSDIDSYVLDQKSLIKGLLDEYRLHLLTPSPSTLILKYEDMTGNFESWLSALLAHTQIEIPERLRDQLIKEHAAMRPVKEDVHKHIRYGRP